MKIYVAGKHIPRAVSVMNMLRNAGHTITYDWANNFQDAELQNVDPKQLAQEERAEVKNADVLVYLWEDNQESARYEAGMAMSLGIPIIVVTQHNSLFFQLLEVTKVESDMQIIDVLNGLDVFKK